MEPGTGDPWCQVEDADVSLVDVAVRNSHDVFCRSWRDIRPAERARVLQAMALVIRKNYKSLAEIESRDCGKLLAESEAMVLATAEWYEYFAGAVSKIVGESAPIGEGVIQFSSRVPFGVVGAIVPGNGPLILTAWKLAPALAAGNTVVVKPHEGTSASLIELMRMWGDILPPGVVNVVTGRGAIVGEALINHPLVRKISFTGGVPNGRLVAIAAAKRLVGCVLELGGKNANIIFADACYENALAGAAAAIFAATGQSCQAGSRILVQRSIYDQFVADFTERAASLRVGHPLDPDTQVGPLGSAAQLDRVLGFVDEAVSDGAKLACGGRRANVAAHPRGYYVQPTVLLNANNQMRICREEIFGPVAVVMPFDDEEDAIRIANDSNFGLVAGLWTSNAYRLHRVAAQLEVGTVFANLYRKVAPEVQFGGFKDSGLGRENGMDVMREYTQLRSVLIETDENRIQKQLVMRIGPDRK